MDETTTADLIRRTEAFFDELPPLLAGIDEHVTRAKTYRAALYAAGLAQLTYPTEFGGGGLDATARSVFDRASSGRVPSEDQLFGIGVGMALPTILKHGSLALQERYLRPGLAGEHVWCQMYSEPGAGSDLAGLTTRAELTPEGWRLNGQKVWTSLARDADFAICLARTDPTVAKHRGITMFVLPMDLPGVTVRPIIQITGDAEFNEIFLDDALVPQDHVIGEVNQGWSVAVSLLNDERKSIGAGGGRQPVGWQDLRELVLSSGTAQDPLVRDALVSCFVGQQLAQLMPQLLAETIAAGQDPGPETSVGKVWRSMNGRAAADLIGTLVFDRDCSWSPGDASETWAHRLLDACALSLGGGTDDIQYNALAEQALRMPRDPYRVDHLPFNQLPTGARGA